MFKFKLVIPFFLIFITRPEYGYSFMYSTQLHNVSGIREQNTL